MKISGFLKRLAAAWLVLRGRIRIEGEGLHCAKRHVGGDEVVIKAVEYKALQTAADNLKYAWGALAAEGKDEAVSRVISRTAAK